MKIVFKMRQEKCYKFLRNFFFKQALLFKHTLNVINYNE